MKEKEQERTAYIEKLVKMQLKRRNEAAVIQIKYENLDRSDENDVSELLIMLDKYCSGHIISKLRRCCYSQLDYAEDILQVARMAAYMCIKTEKTSDKKNFAGYVYRIYRNKMYDFFRSQGQLEETSMETAKGKGGLTLGETLEAEEREPWLDEERITLYKRILTYICRAIMESKEYPPKSLAVIFAQIISHIHGAIPAYKMSSAKWAFEVMSGKNVGLLGRESEQSIQKSLNDDLLKWGDLFISQINDRPKEDCGEEFLRDVIYTNVYSQKQIDKWISNYRGGMIKRTQKYMRTDKELLDLAKEYIFKGDFLYNIVNGRKKDETSIR
ncbi:MAG: hypothetical protein K5989_02950 [Lachnospiraceae bacterium]|nr:hypothetical protein [Lachnospiraceae bacterium]